MVFKQFLIILYRLYPKGYNFNHLEEEILPADRFHAN